MKKFNPENPGYFFSQISNNINYIARGNVSSGDLNNLTSCGTYNCDNCTNSPYTYAKVVVESDVANSWQRQTATNILSPYQSCYRIKNGSDWGVWVSMSNFGVNTNGQCTPYYGDLNDITVTSTYFTSSATHSPYGVSNGFITTLIHDTNYAKQIYKPFDRNVTIERTKKYGSWGNWFFSNSDTLNTLLTADAYFTAKTYALGDNWDNYKEIIISFRYSDNGTQWYTHIPVNVDGSVPLGSVGGFHCFSAYGPTVHDAYGYLNPSNTAQMVVQGTISGSWPYLLWVAGRR